MNIFHLPNWCPQMHLYIARGHDSCNDIGPPSAQRMITSSDESIFRVTGLLCGEFTGHRWIPAQRPVTRRFDVFFYLCPNNWLSKQWRRWWFETPSRLVWRHCNGQAITWLLLANFELDPWEQNIENWISKTNAFFWGNMLLKMSSTQ